MPNFGPNPNFGELAIQGFIEGTRQKQQAQQFAAQQALALSRLEETVAARKEDTALDRERIDLSERGVALQERSFDELATLRRLQEEALRQQNIGQGFSNEALARRSAVLSDPNAIFQVGNMRIPAAAVELGLTNLYQTNAQLGAAAGRQQAGFQHDIDMFDLSKQLTPQERMLQYLTMLNTAAQFPLLMNQADYYTRRGSVGGVGGVNFSPEEAQRALDELRNAQNQ